MNLIESHWVCAISAYILPLHSTFSLINQLLFLIKGCENSKNNFEIQDQMAITIAIIGNT